MTLKILFILELRTPS